MARPTKYSDAMREAICVRLRTGCTRTAAVESLGISYEIFRQWMANKLELFEAVIRAEAEAEAMFTATIAKAARGTDKVPGDWRAAESWLKRRRRDVYGDSLDLRKLSDDDILRLLASESGSAPQGLEPAISADADKSVQPLPK